MTEVAKSVKEVSEAITYFLHAVKVGADIVEDNKVTLGDAGSLLSLFDGINDAISGAGQIPAELKDLDLAEIDSLIELIITNYEATNEKAKEILEAALKALRANYVVYTLLRG